MCRYVGTGHRPAPAGVGGDKNIGRRKGGACGEPSEIEKEYLEEETHLYGFILTGISIQIFPSRISLRLVFSIMDLTASVYFLNFSNE